jgi:peptidoglycan/xylan/chitin deacetylase (PgdA/CDA1 family)
MNVTIVMYHYVRDLKHSRYPEIRGLDILHFQEQVYYLKNNYNFITMEMLIDAIDHNSLLPPNSVLLTFDDAYSDHFKYVFPFLQKLKIQGSFFAPVKAITENVVLDVNKIHFILSKEIDKPRIFNEIKYQLNHLSDEYNLESYSFYFKKYAISSRYDSAEVMFIKNLFQFGLEELPRKIIVNNIFEKIVDIDEEIFSKELYMDIEQLECMSRNGMHIGAHGYNHYWLGSLSKENQKNEIEKSLEFLNQIHCEVNNWTMCYPYGNYNESTIELLEDYNCKLALTTEVNIADLNSYNKYKLPRLDTNDLPKHRDACTNEWYLKV